MAAEPRSESPLDRLRGGQTLELYEHGGGRELSSKQWDDYKEVVAEVVSADLCPHCGHAWDRHDPEDGMCDAPSAEGLGACSCGRDLAWTQEQIATRSREALAS